jgi:sulfate/thiosulfate transport system substrate-binding protein
VSVITADPKSSGGARWSYLAAWGWGVGTGGDKATRGQGDKATRGQGDKEKSAKEFLRRVYENVPAFPSGARGATTTFENGVGDILISWENEALRAVQEFGEDKLEVVVPSVSILAEPAVAWVDASIDEHKNRAVAEEYLRYLYSPEGQELAAKDFYRPRSKQAEEKFPGRFAKVELFTIEDLGGWVAVQKKHFASGGILDQVRRR